MQPFENTLDLSALIKSALRNIHYFLAAFLACGLVVTAYYIYATLISPTYSSKSLLLVNVSEQASFVITDTSKAAVISQLSQNADTYVHLLKSETLLQKTINDLALPTTADAFLQSLNVHTVPGTPFIQLDVSWDDPQTAFDIAQSIIGIFPGVVADSGLDGTLVVIDRPSFADAPNHMAPFMLAAIVLGGGFILGFLAVLLDELLYGGFRTEEDVSHHLHTENFGLFASDAFHPVFATANTARRRQTAARELYFNVRQSAAPILVTSASDTEDRLEVSFALAQAAMENGDQTLFIAAGPSKSDIARLHTPVQNFIKEAGVDANGEPNAAAIILPLQKDSQVDIGSLQKIVCRQSVRYDMVVVDFPSLENHWELQQAEDCFHEAVLVLSHNHTSVKTALRQQECLKRCGLTLRGTVLTKVSTAGLYSYYRMLRAHS